MALFTLQFDIVAECVSLVTTLIIAGFSLYAYHRTQSPRHLAFAVAFGLLSIASLCSITFDWLVELEVMQVPVRGFLAIPAQYDIFRFLDQLFAMAGYLILFMTAERLSRFKTIVLLLLIAPLTALVAHEVFSVYHAVAMIVLGFCLHHFYKSFLESGSKNARNIAIGFGLLLLSELTFIFLVLNVSLYHWAIIMRVAGFLVLLYTIGRIYFLAESLSAATLTAREVREAATVKRPRGR